MVVTRYVKSHEVDGVRVYLYLVRGRYMARIRTGSGERSIYLGIRGDVVDSERAARIAVAVYNLMEATGSEVPPRCVAQLLASLSVSEAKN